MVVCSCCGIFPKQMSAAASTTSGGHCGRAEVTVRDCRRCWGRCWGWGTAALPPKELLGGGSSSSSCASPACAKPLFPGALLCHDLCPCLAEVHKGLPGLGTWWRKPSMPGDDGSCVAWNLQAAVTQKLQPQKSLRSFPRTLPKSQTKCFNCPTSKDYFPPLFHSQGADIYKGVLLTSFSFLLREQEALGLFCL